MTDRLVAWPRARALRHLFGGPRGIKGLVAVAVPLGLWLAWHEPHTEKRAMATTAAHQTLVRGVVLCQ